jgi:hypothetical protein
VDIPCLCVGVRRDAGDVVDHRGPRLNRIIDDAADDAADQTTDIHRALTARHVCTPSVEIHQY